MEKTVALTLNGQELGQADFNGAAATAGLADDRVLAELFRLPPWGGGTSKAIIPYGYDAGNGSVAPNAGLVMPSGSADGKVLVYPFRAIVGSRSGGTDPLPIWRDVRSGIFVGPVTTDPAPVYQQVQLAATSANNRIDLVYAQLALNTNAPTVNRYLRDPATGIVSNIAVAVTYSNIVTVGVVAGTEATSPTQPAVPSDTGSNYYFPLAFVYLTHPFTTGSTVGVKQIDEVAEIAQIARATGASSFMPANGTNVPGGYADAQQGWGPSNKRPSCYLPPSMSGAQTRLITLDFNTSPPSVPLNAITVLDNSCDWRKRIFRWHAIAEATSGGGFIWDNATNPFPNSSASFRGIGTKSQIGVGQSFRADSGSNYSVAFLAASEMSAGLAADIEIVVLTNGALAANITSSSPTSRVWIWLEATAPFPTAL